MSKAHQYIELQDSVFSRYVKTTVGSLTGMRANPHDIKLRIPFILETPEEAIIYEEKDNYAEYRGRGPIVYDKEVLEVYTAEEDAILRRVNAALFQEGLLVPYEKERETVVSRNELTESEVIKIAGTKLPTVFKSQLTGITSKTTLTRIKDALDALGRPKSFYTILETHEATLA
jgi:hypothetical protein